MNKKTLTETDIRTKFITPAILGESGSKWNVMTQVLEELYFTKGRVIVRGKTVCNVLRSTMKIKPVCPEYLQCAS